MIQLISLNHEILSMETMSKDVYRVLKHIEFLLNLNVAAFGKDKTNKP